MQLLQSLKTTMLDYRKYYPLIISASLFLTFDLGVLVPNFIISSHLKDDAIGINLSGRQRMLSQRTVKALLQLKVAELQGQPSKIHQKELNLAYQLFDETLEGFYQGKMVTGGDGKPVFLKAVETEKAKKLVMEARQIWLKYKEKLSPILGENKQIKPPEMEGAIAYAATHNLKLLDLMNQLTFELQEVANGKAVALQRIQTGGLTLALINFFILLYHTIRKLKSRDTELEKANAQIVNLNERLKEENLRMGAELDITRRLQRMILPKDEELNKIRNLDIAGFMEAAQEVGGDYYDVMKQGEGIKIGIGDVTGHGLESGVLMIMVQTAVRTLLEMEETDPKRFISVLNRIIYDNVQRMKSDKNLSFSLLDYEDGNLRLFGQHEEMIIVRSEGKIERIDTLDLGFPIGLDSEIAQFVDETKIELSSGDVVVLYTDGITEAENEKGVRYGLERLCQVVQEHRDRNAQEIKKAAIEDVHRHIGQQKVYDDITLIVLKQK